VSKRGIDENVIVRYSDANRIVFDMNQLSIQGMELQKKDVVK